MNRFITLLIPVLIVLAGCGAGPGGSGAGEITSDEAIARLDSVMALRPRLAAQTRRAIDSLWILSRGAVSPRERFDVLEKLFGQYSSYSMDSMLLVARMCKAEAEANLGDSLYWRAVIMESEGLKGQGQYFMALSRLREMPLRWQKVYRQSLMQRYISIYYSLSDYAHSREDSLRYHALLESYRDTVIAEAAPDSPSRRLNRAEQLRVGGHPSAALAEMDSLHASMPGVVDPGVESFVRGKCYQDLGDTERAKICFAVAAAYDLSKSVRKYEALQELARILSDEGDDGRAYKYIMCAITDIQASNARSRFQKLSSYQPIIAAAYAETQERSNMTKSLLLAIALLLLVGLLVALLFIRQKNIGLARERHDLRQKNIELEQLRSRLSDANRSLEESAKVKEDYLGYLFNLCSEYIDSLESYRKQLQRRLKSGKISDIDSLLSATQGGEHLQSFFKKFDAIILDIFPDFIEKINALLSPDYQLRPKPGELLSPELRIYALVRLGVTDSTRIAAFLHYSPQTVYNYRFRVRSHSLLPKEEFPLAVRKL